MLFFIIYIAVMLQSVRTFASHAEGWVLNPSRDRPKSYKQVVTAPLLNARQQERVTQVLGNDPYKRMPRCITVGVAR